jgi:hypothetical protein
MNSLMGSIPETLTEGAMYGFRTWGWRYLLAFLWAPLIPGLVGAIIGYATGHGDREHIVNGAAIGFAAAELFVVLVGTAAQQAAIDARISKRIEDAEQIATREPERAKPAWDVARITLDAYFSRNLGQISMIFALSVVVMLVGFSVMIWGVAKAFSDSKAFPAATVATSAGVLTQFIGGSFLLVYRSAIRQAMMYSATLERMNSVGMAMQILDTMTDPSEKDLASATKAELVKLLIKQVANAKGDSQAEPLKIELIKLSKSNSEDS